MITSAKTNQLNALIRIYLMHHDVKSFYRIKNSGTFMCSPLPEYIYVGRSYA